MANTGSVAPQYRLFVGHLPLLTTDQDFQAAFSGSKFTVAQVITRGRRPLGHGFVDFANADDLNNALNKYQTFQILGQEVKVEVARPREERPPRQNNDNGANQAQNGQGQNGQGQNGQGRRNGRQNNNNGQAQNFNNNGGQFQQQNNNPGFNTFQNNTFQNQNFGGNDQHTNGPRNNRNTRRNNRRNDNGFPDSTQNFQNNTFQNNTFQNNTTNQDQNDGPARPRRQREPREPRETVLSTTTVYVTNLPFSYTDDDLFNLFKQHTTNPKSARINQRKQGNKSRGVGFVEYENQAGQAEAIAKLAGFMVPDGEKPPRKINVVVSQTHPNPNANNDGNAGNSQQ